MDIIEIIRLFFSFLHYHFHVILVRQTLYFFVFKVKSLKIIKLYIYSTLFEYKLSSSTWRHYILHKSFGTLYMPQIPSGG